MEKREKLSFNTNAKLGKLVGRELITNNIIAVFELIKNSYDAFANVVCIEFVNFDTSGADEELRDRNKRDIIVSKPSSKIIISDDGWGMSFFEIKNNWMEIGTTSKEDLTEQRIMHGSRILKRVINGEKGIGRFGCDKLGSGLIMTTTGDKGFETSELHIDWSQLDDHTKKLQDIEFECKVNKNITPIQTGMQLEISDLRDFWTNTDIWNLKKQLKKMISPFAHEQNDFNIILKFGDHKEKIVNDSLEYATTGIHATLSCDGKLDYSIFDESFSSNNTIHLNKPSFGPVEIKILYMDAGAKRAFARRNGISTREYGNIKLFRDNFRILPYGEMENDWLGIDNKHAQAVFRSLGTRDIIGYVQITKSQNPWLKDATNRQGLNEDIPEYADFKDFIWKIIDLLQAYIFDRIKTEAKKQGKIIQTTVEDIKQDLMSFKSELPQLYNDIDLPEQKKQSVINQTLKSFGTIEKNIQQVEKANKELSKRLIVMEKIVGTETMLYDLLHAIKNKLDALNAMVVSVDLEAQKNHIHFNKPAANKITDEISRMIFAALKRTSPKRSKREYVILVDVIQSFISEKELVYPHISFELNGIVFNRINCNVDGFRTVLDNLLSNSIKALKNIQSPRVAISMEIQNGQLKIYFEDNGCGISDEDSPFIFNVSFSRTEGTGIGLASSLAYMKEQNGDISYIKNGPLGGALFELSFPLKH
jgi:signal transduction histidine kinase